VQWDFQGRAVFISGASRGLGRAFALAYAKAGASYIGIGARSSLDQVKTDVENAGKAAGRKMPKVVAVNLDVTDQKSTEGAAREIQQSFGRLDILVNNSGYQEENARMLDVDPKDWWRTFEVNTLGTYLMTRAFLPLLLSHKESYKTIVGITSIWGLTMVPSTSAYQLSKHTMMRFSEICNSEYGDQGILCFHIHPGAVLTEMSSQMHPDIRQFLVDTPELGADTLVWLTAERRDWLAGRYVSAQWSMEELLAKKDKIAEENHLLNRMNVGLD
jgi:NAD(P)-dependent dehydrogenase (short-subunit alcohol dehydrogenase family)